MAEHKVRLGKQDNEGLMSGYQKGSHSTRPVPVPVQELVWKSKRVERGKLKSLAAQLAQYGL